MGDAERTATEQIDLKGESGPIVEFKDVTITFDVKPVLENISFSVDRGQTLIILGPAGCGKSVLLKLANGLLKPDSGSIRIFGQEITTMRERELFALRAHIGMVFQESALFDSLTVEDNVAYRLHEERVSEDEAHKRVVEALKFVELEQAIDKFPAELSGGMRRRVSIARAIITQPDLILYDSPTGGLDPITSTTIIELVMKQRDVSHTTSLVVTHRLQDAFVMATHRYNAEKGMVPLPKDGPEHGIDSGTKFLLLNDGGIKFHGTTKELVHSDDPWIKEYLA
ncbi:MAG TPA: ATP-binding cassette domain-containing protein [Acidobacteriaceae bacterium]|jgi:phospholipid/cholesterol/gamma-HCH transport system ATP-binding protein|nr:ATP-binding cassette domain-containing protein [Acidobacteriaceae bacterium]